MDFINTYSYELALVFGSSIITWVLAGLLFHFFKNPFDL